MKHSHCVFLGTSTTTRSPPRHSKHPKHFRNFDGRMRRVKEIHAIVHAHRNKQPHQAQKSSERSRRLVRKLSSLLVLLHGLKHAVGVQLLLRNEIRKVNVVLHRAGDALARAVTVNTNKKSIPRKTRKIQVRQRKAGPAGVLLSEHAAEAHQLREIADRQQRRA